MCKLSHVHSLWHHWPRPSGSSAHGIFQTRILEGVLFPTPEDLSNPWIKLLSPASLALAGGFFTTEPPGKPKRKHRDNRQQSPSSGLETKGEVRPLGFRSLERVLCEAGIQSMQLSWCCFPRQVTRRLVLGVRKRLETGTICSGHSQLLLRQQW